jgi:hypothetical protein
MKSINISIGLLFLTIILSVAFSHYIDYFMVVSLQQLREKYTGAISVSNTPPSNLPPELQSVKTQFYDNRQ